MNRATNNEMTWFIKRLIDIRNDVNRTPNHIADIKFDYREIISQKIIFGKMDKSLAQRKVCDMLALVKNDYTFLNSLDHFDERRLVYEILSTDGDILIKGYQMEVLEGYMKKIKGEKKVDSKSTESRIIIRKDNGDFYINEANGERFLNLKKNSLYYEAFVAMYSLIPDGGTISFSEYKGSASSRIKRGFLNKTQKKQGAKINSYLNDKTNGFLRASKINDSKFKDGRSLIECNPVEGTIFFNNKK